MKELLNPITIGAFILLLFGFVAIVIIYINERNEKKSKQTK